MSSNVVSPCALLVSALLVAVGASRAQAVVTPIVINLPTRGISYSSVDDTLYVSVANASATNPNTLTPINPYTGILGSAIPVGFEPNAVVVSNDGTTMHVVFGGDRGVQPFDVPTHTLGTAFTIAGGPQVKQIHSIPGRPNAVLIATAMPGFSPPATGTFVWENGIQLPDHVGSGLGTGGPDTVAVDLLNGTRGYGYQNTVSSYTNWSMTIGPNGVFADNGPTLQNILTGGFGQIELLGNRLFTAGGGVYSLTPALQVGSFQGGGNFLVDPELGRLFSVTTSGSTQTVRAYSLATMQIVGTETLTGISGDTRDLTRFGSNGLAFRTANDRLVIMQSTIVPEPATIILLAIGGVVVSFAKCRSRRQR